MEVSSAWERHATDWITWARTPGHDAFWSDTWPAVRALLPEPGERTLDLGSGEGRLSRELAALGHRVVGLDRSPTLARAARDAADLPVALADAAAVPFADGAFDLVVACMVLHDVDDLAATGAEIARVLRPGGRLVVAIVHPFITARDDELSGTDEFRVGRPYLAPRRFADRAERDGLAMTFESVHRPLSAYVAALGAHGLGITDLHEAGPRVVPWLLTFAATRLPTGA
ncbi:class I SAM-dependent methyltransferase [Nocardioides mangrovi]|uniref:Class I SAM-dependent methyltransferase n=1 Tax=Nocardioides mangrovi TaxID=2874580 RepID=A0ABS7U742_9ACTN|nr:class I SAM-dependent methyltransferase [Nocardioides mangrovi]MBZ5736774.1 class I SAM-dependent methyltransferase [Nocardioides mangrovi]